MINYKLLPDAMYVLPNQIMNPLVVLNGNFELSIEEYQ